MSLQTNIVAGFRKGTNSPPRPTVARFKGPIRKGVLALAAQRGNLTDLWMREFLRLLPQPIYRYSSSAADVVDGAMFVFVEGTDPEAFLLFEAAGKDNPIWRCGFARMNLVEFWGRYKNDVVWHVDPVDWNVVFEKHAPYALVRETPRRGLDRSR